MSTSSPAIGILLCNLGTPEAPTTRALRTYLRQFLSDPRVVEAPRAQWLPVLHAFILPFRPRKSAALYRKIWTPDGPPLLVLSERLRAAVETAVRHDFADPLPERRPRHREPRHAPATSNGLGAHGPRLVVALGMRYGNPSIAHALRTLRTAGCSRLVVLPLYPQYSAATTASTFDAVWEELRTWRVVPEIRTITSYAEEAAYIDALARSVRERWDSEGKPERLLLSFHGIPKRYEEAGDPYTTECRRTADLFIERLGIDRARCVLSFQSIFGKEEWVKPATDETVKRLAREGVGSVDVICPGFAVDCLETLEEIDGLNREFFLAAGGTRFRYIGCLNDRPDHARMLAGIVKRTLEGWLLPEPAEEPLAWRS